MRPALLTVWPESERSYALPAVIRSYRDAARAAHAELYPAGRAWQAAWRRNPRLPLYGADGFHPSQLGTYLTALVVARGPTGTSRRSTGRFDQPARLPAERFGGASETAARRRSRGDQGEQVNDARRAALTALIDHAPLFPPASLPMPDALDEDRRARADENSWLLARLVWPASRLDELEGEDRTLSVLLDAPYTADPRAEAVETRWGSGLEGLEGEAYVELPLDEELEERVAELAEHGLRAKVRCGGAEVPSRAELGRFLRACRDAGVPFKATAGLHHPLAAAERHGFLNVLAACAFDDGARSRGTSRSTRRRSAGATAKPVPRSSRASDASSSSPSAAARSSSPSTS